MGGMCLGSLLLPRRDLGPKPSTRDRPKSLNPDLALLTVRLRGRSSPRPPAGARAGPSPGELWRLRGGGGLSTRPGDFSRLARSSREPLRSRPAWPRPGRHIRPRAGPRTDSSAVQAQVLIRATAALLPATEDPRVPVQPTGIGARQERSSGWRTRPAAVAAAWARRCTVDQLGVAQAAEEDGQQGEDLVEAQAHGQGGDGELPLLGPREFDGLGQPVPELGVLAAEDFVLSDQFVSVGPPPCWASTAASTVRAWW